MMNLKCSVCMLIAAVAVVTIAADNAVQNNEKQPANDTAQGYRGFKDKQSYVQMKAFGGRIRKKGSAKGVFVFLNAQKAVLRKDLQSALDQIDRSVRPIVKFEDANVDISNVKDSISKLGGKLGVAIVENETLPALLTAPEEGWAIVNVAALKRDNPAADKLASRVRKEMLRGFALAGGCSFMCRGAIVMRDIATLPELDDITIEEFGIDAITHLDTALPTRGVTPWIESSYRAACKEGWAPQPTNEYQKAIWDKIHAMPTKPIVIEPEKQ